jgi:hypothetical protein
MNEPVMALSFVARERIAQFCLHLPRIVVGANRRDRKNAK